MSKKIFNFVEKGVDIIMWCIVVYTSLRRTKAQRNKINAEVSELADEQD